MTGAWHAPDLCGHVTCRMSVCKLHVCLSSAWVLCILSPSSRGGTVSEKECYAILFTDVLLLAKQTAKGTAGSGSEAEAGPSGSTAKPPTSPSEQSKKRSNGNGADGSSGNGGAANLTLSSLQPTVFRFQFKHTIHLEGCALQLPQSSECTSRCPPASGGVVGSERFVVRVCHTHVATQRGPPLL